VRQPDLPAVAVALLERLVPARGRAEVIGDLAEEYVGRRLAMGPVRARAWLWGQVLSLLIAWIRHACGIALRARTFIQRDVQLAVRSALRHPLATLGSAAMLGVGLAAVALSGALGHVLLDRPVSAVHGAAVQRLAAIEQAGREQSRFSWPEWRRIEESLGSAATVSAVGLEPALVAAGTARRQTLAEIVSTRHGDVIGMFVRAGRPLMAPDFLDGSAPTAVISESLWAELFARSPAALGAPIAINGRPFSIAGIARAGPPTTFWGAGVDVWVPLAHGDAFFSPGWRTAQPARALTAFVLPHASPAVVNEQLRRAAADLGDEYPEAWRRRTLALTPGTSLLGSQRDNARLLSRALAGLSLLILVVASANLGATMLAGAAAGRRALAIHAAIGAGPGAGPRRLLIEGALVGAAGAAAAAGLYAMARVRIAEIALLPTLSLRIDLPPAPAMLSVLAPAGIAAGVLMAAGPAAWIARQALGAPALGSGVRSAGDRGIARTRRVLVTAQIALAVVLLSGAMLFARSLDRLTHADLGIARDRLVAFDFDIEPAETGGQPLATVAAEALRRVRAMPGVAAAAMASRAPVDASTPATSVSTTRNGGAIAVEATFNTVSAGYFETIGVPIVLGRAFRDDETSGVAIVNETLAGRLWGDDGALDRAITTETAGETLRVVGVARDAKYRSVRETAQPHFYIAAPPAFGQALLVRTAGDPRRALAEVQRVLDGLGVAGFFPRTADDHLAIQWLPTRAVSTVAGWLSVLAVIFCAAGLYGLVGWFAELRRSEMAIRLALGATRLDIERLVVGHALGIAGPGLLMGVVLAGCAASAARAFLYGLDGMDLLGPAAGVGLMLALVVAASWKPARAAARTNPAETLRS